MAVSWTKVVDESDEVVWEQDDPGVFRVRVHKRGMWWVGEVWQITSQGWEPRWDATWKESSKREALKRATAMRRRVS